MCFYIPISFRDIHYQNVPKTFGTPCTLKNTHDSHIKNTIKLCQITHYCQVNMFQNLDGNYLN